MNIELLHKIKTAILEEPRRINMDDWLYESFNAPCGTAGCIAGWASILSEPDRTPKQALASYRLRAEFAWSIAMRELNISAYDAEGLFYVTNWPPPFRESLAQTPIGSHEYAQVVADRIDYFIEHGR